MKTLLVVASAACFVACGPQATCVTPCGMITYESNAQCESLKTYEAQTLQVAEDLSSLDKSHFCSRLKGFELQLHPTDSPDGTWHDNQGLEVYAETFLEPYNIIQLATFDWPKSHLAHELIHANDDVNDIMHYGWVQTHRWDVDPTVVSELQVPSSAQSP